MDGVVLDRLSSRLAVAGSRGAAVVEVRDPFSLTRAERAALLDRCSRRNMAVYASARRADDPALGQRLGAQLGLGTPQPIASPEPDTLARVPWHTEGYRNPAGLTVRSAILHCVGGDAGAEISLLDPRLAWLRLREQGECFVHALMQPDAFTVPGRDEPHAVFAVDAAGELHVRFTERRDAIRWKCDATVSEAAARLRRILDREPCVVRVRLEDGMGIAGNNLLLSRAMLGGAGAAEMRRTAFRERIGGA